MNPDIAYLGRQWLDLVRSLNSAIVSDLSALVKSLTREYDLDAMRRRR